METQFRNDWPVSVRMLTPELALFYQEMSFDDMHCEYGSASIDIEIYAIVNPYAQEFRFLTTLKDWRKIYDHEMKYVPKAHVKDKIWVWRKIQELTPYSELSKKSQIYRDQQNGDYPNPDSKYFEDISTEALEQMLEDERGALGENMNDWRMYRDPVPEGYVRRTQYEINKLATMVAERRKDNDI